MEEAHSKPFLRIRDPRGDCSVLPVGDKLRVGRDLLWRSADAEGRALPCQVQDHADNLVAQGVRPESGLEPGLVLDDRFEFQRQSAQPSLEQLRLPEIQIHRFLRSAPAVRAYEGL